MSGGSGNDQIRDAHEVFAGSGNDIVSATGNIDGGTGDDTITAVGGDQQIKGGDGRDRIRGGNRFNLIYASSTSITGYDPYPFQRNVYSYALGGNKADVLIGGPGRNFLMGDYEPTGVTIDEIVNAYEHGNSLMRFLASVDQEDGWGNLYIIDANDVVIDSNAIRGIVGSDRKLYRYVEWSAPAGSNSSPPSPTWDDVVALYNWLVQNGPVPLPGENSDQVNTNTSTFPTITFVPSPVQRIPRNTDVYIYIEDIAAQFGWSNIDDEIISIADAHFEHEDEAWWLTQLKNIFDLIGTKNYRYEF